MLSKKLGRPFIDTDLLLVSEYGRSIKEIVDSEGWAKFRKLEHEIVKQVCRNDRQVVATGGGVALRDANVNLMKKNGKLVWLTARAETISKRMMLDQNTAEFRPALSFKDSFSEVEDTLAEREPVYKKAMDFHVETDEKKVEDICDLIIQQL